MAGVQKLGIMGINYIGQIAFRRTVWVWRIRVICQTLEVGRRRIHVICRTVLCPAVQRSDSAMSNCPMVGQCCIQLSNGRIVLCPAVQWLDSAVSNCPMVRQFCVHLFNGQSVLCPTVQWSHSVVYNCPMVRQFCV